MSMLGLRRRYRDYPRATLERACFLALEGFAEAHGEREALSTLLPAWLSDPEGEADPPTLSATDVEALEQALKRYVS